MPSLQSNDLAVNIKTTADNSGIDSTDQAVNRLEQTQSKATKTGFDWGGSIQKAGLLAGTLVGALGLATKGAVDQTAAYEQSRISFETMLGSAEKAKTLLRQISDFAAATPFELPQVVEGSKNLLAFGVAQEDVIGTFKTLGNIAAGVGNDKLPGLITVFGQVKAAGRMMTQDMLQFTSAGVPMIDLLAQHFGVAKDKVSDLVQNGKVKFADLKASLELLGGPAGKWGDLMAKQSQTFSGTMSNISDNMGRILRQAVGIGPDGDIRQGSLFSTLVKGATDFMNWLGNMQPVMDNVVHFFESNSAAAAALAGVLGGVVLLPIIAIVMAIGWIPLAIAGAIAAIGALIGWLVTEFNKPGSAIKAIADIIGNVLGPPLKDLWNEIVTNLLPALQNWWNFMGPVLIPALKILGAIIGGTIVATIYVLIQTIRLVVAIFTWWISTGVAATKALISGIEWMVTAYMNYVKAVWKVVTDVGKFFSDLWNLIANGFKTAINAIGAGLDYLRNHFFEVIGFIIGFVLTLPLKIIAAFVMMLVFAIEAIVNLYNSIVKWIGDAVNWVSRINWGAIWNNLVNAVWGAVNNVWNAITSTIGNAVNWVAGINWWGILSGIGGAIWNAAGQIWNAISGVFNRVMGLNWGGILIGIGKGIGNAIIDLVNGAIRGAFSGVPVLQDHIPQIPHFAKGVRNFSGGVALVGEEGPELVNLPQGSNVFTNKDTAGMLGAGGGGNYNHYGDIILQNDSAVNAYFTQIDRNNELARRGLTTVKA